MLIETIAILLVILLSFVPLCLFPIVLSMGVNAMNELHKKDKELDDENENNPTADQSTGVIK